MDYQLDAESTKRLENHLHHCPQCKLELDELIMLRQQCMSLPELDISEGFHERLMLRLRTEEVKKARIIPYRILAPIAAALLLFLIGKGLINTSLDRAKDNPPEDISNSAMMVSPEQDTTIASKSMGDFAGDGVRSDSGESAGSGESAENGESADKGIADTAIADTAGLVQGDMEVIESPKKLDSSFEIAKAPTEENNDYKKYGMIIGSILIAIIILIRFLKSRR